MKPTKREKRQRRQDDADLRAVLSTEEGRRFLFRWIDREAGTFSASFTGQAPTTDYREGRRSIGIALMTEAQRVAPDLYVQALQEQLERQQDRQREEDLRRQREEAERAQVAGEDTE